MDVMSAEFVAILFVHAQMVHIQANFSRSFQEADVCIGDIPHKVHLMKAEFTDKYIQSSPEMWGKGKEAMDKLGDVVMQDGKNTMTRVHEHEGQQTQFVLSVKHRDKAGRLPSKPKWFQR
jgi:hypothetical protein